MHRSTADAWSSQKLHPREASRPSWQTGDARQPWKRRAVSWKRERCRLEAAPAAWALISRLAQGVPGVDVFSGCVVVAASSRCIPLQGEHTPAACVAT
eukprot:7270884-Pyramimonas_sp.AAC.1